MYVTLSGCVNVSLPGFLTASICGLPCLSVCVLLCVCVLFAAGLVSVQPPVRCSWLFCSSWLPGWQAKIVFSFVQRQSDGVCATAVRRFAHVKHGDLQAFWECRLNIASCSYSGLNWIPPPFRASCLDRPQMTKTSGRLYLSVFTMSAFLVIWFSEWQYVAHLKREFTQKFSNHLLTLKPFKTCMAFSTVQLNRFDLWPLFAKAISLSFVPQKEKSCMCRTLI